MKKVREKLFFPSLLVILLVVGIFTSFAEYKSSSAGTNQKTFEVITLENSSFSYIKYKLLSGYQHWLDEDIKTVIRSLNDFQSENRVEIVYYEFQINRMLSGNYITGVWVKHRPMTSENK